jgi:hypothetical protein
MLRYENRMSFSTCVWPTSGAISVVIIWEADEVG